jgi:hypothetical protein
MEAAAGGGDWQWRQWAAERVARGEVVKCWAWVRDRKCYVLGLGMGVTGIRFS